MPLFFQKRLNENTHLAVWEIMETEQHFLNKVSLQKEITHPHKRLQHLAGRYLLQFLEPGFPLQSLTINDSRKPVVADDSFHFSISHCGNFVAAIVSTKTNVGIDVELISPKIGKLASKFLSTNELQLIEEISEGNDRLKWLTLTWSCKEAMFKWYGKGKVDFRKNMALEALDHKADSGSIKASFQKENHIALHPVYLFFQDLCLVWVEK